mgnify:CR=1 FL=1
MKRRKLPIGIQTFREMLEGGYYYVDMTGLALRLIEEGKYYFLSRPRRSGKSPFLDKSGANHWRASAVPRAGGGAGLGLAQW